MENKILVLNDKQEKIGETFARRAKQLVNQQRAEYTDGSHKAIRFFPDAEEVWEESAAAEPVHKSEGRLLALAEKRIQEKNLFIVHSAVIFPVYIALFFIRGIIFYYNGFESDINSLFWFISGGWTGMYIMHLYFYNRDSIRSFFLSDKKEKEERRVQRLTEEVERLKRMGYAE